MIRDASPGLGPLQKSLRALDVAIELAVTALSHGVQGEAQWNQLFDVIRDLRNAMADSYSNGNSTTTSTNSPTETP